jgi:NADH dehydrogenase
VKLRLGTPIAAVHPGGVDLTDGTTVPAGTVVWAAGVRPNPLAERLGLRLAKDGAVEVGEDLCVPGHPEVFVIGDLASTPAGLPRLAPVAIQGGRHTAATIVRRLEGRPTKRFRYRDKGTMATIGRRAAVADLPLGIRLGGTVGWLAWLGVHLVFLIGFRRRVLVLITWAWNYVTWENGNRAIVTEDVHSPTGRERA